MINPMSVHVMSMSLARYNAMFLLAARHVIAFVVTGPPARLPRVKTV